MHNHATAPHADSRRARRAHRPTLAEMFEEVLDLSAGLGVLLLPVLLTAVPGIILFVVLPAILLLAVTGPPAAIAAAIAAPPYLLVRSLRRRRGQVPSRRRPTAGGSGRAAGAS